MKRATIAACLSLQLTTNVLSFNIQARHRSLSHERKNKDLIHPQAFYSIEETNSNRRKILEKISSLYSSPTNEPSDNNNDVWDEGKDDETPEQRRRLRDWMYSGGGNSPLVQPVQWEDELPPKEERKTVTPKFGSLFDGMPKLNEILGGDETVDSTPSVAETETSISDSDDSWFDEERDSIQQEYDQVRKEIMKTLEEDESPPENALAVVESVLKQEMERELRDKKDQRMKEQLEAYEKDLIQRNADMPESPPHAILELMDQSDKDFARSEKIRQRVEDYKQYEKSVMSSYSEDDVSTTSDEPIDDVNNWAMERLQSMIDDDSTDNDEASEMIKDILRENLEDLSERMNRPAVKDSSMKEWQMYRAIASRMDEESPDENEILKRVDSWKEYVRREEDLRQRNGLSDSGNESSVAVREPMGPTEKATKEERIQTRKTLNRMSIEALESLLKTADSSRREKLKSEIEFLKTTLEENDYLDVDESFLDEENTYNPSSPIDTADLFDHSFTSEDTMDDSVQRLQAPAPEHESEFTSMEPNTGFEASSHQSSQITPPNTPFFRDDVPGDSSTSLGSMEDQKLISMYRRAGATTEEEREKIRKSYEEFKRLEAAQRRASGLSDDTDERFAKPELLRYNISDVMKDDGDFNASAVLSSIGPRPVRSKKQADPGLADSLYRAVSAVGGGKYKDDSEKDAEQRASFLEFVDKQNQAREALDGENAITIVGANSAQPTSLDDEEYAERILASLGERPKPKRERFLSAEELSDRGGLRPGAVDEEDEDDDEEDFELGLIPEWLRKEGSTRGRTMRGKDIEDAFDDSYYEHNARQLAEFERRRRGLGKSIGIDISDVLGRSNVETDDYADFKFDDPYARNTQVDWGSSAFQARKQNLLEYIELDLEEVNSLMEHKDSVYVKGFSPYLPQINKPFLDYGAIFKLESVLVDVSALQASVWVQIAKERNFPRPTMDEIKKASLVRPDEAARSVFFWSNDLRECRQIASRHRELFRSEFNLWLTNNNINREDFVDKPPPSETNEDLLPNDEKTQLPSSRKLSEREFLDKAKSDWSEVAKRIGADPPSEDEIIIAFSVGNEIAVKEIFGWATDVKEIERIVNILDEVSGRIKELTENDSPNKETGFTREAAMEAHYRAWLATAGKFKLRPPSEDEVLAAFVINDPEIAATGFGWEGDSVKDAVKFFVQQLDEPLARQFLSSTPDAAMTSQSDAMLHSNKKSSPIALNDFDLQTKVWSAVAHKMKFANPDSDEILFAMSVGPEDAIVNGFGWAKDTYDVERLVELYYGALEQEASLTILRTLPPVARLIQSDDLTDNLDVVYQSIYESWIATAQQLGYADPTMEEVQFAMTVGLEEAVMFGFQWTQDRKEVSNIVRIYRDNLSQKRSAWTTDQVPSTSSAPSQPTPTIQAKAGARKWLKALADVEMQCCVVSNLEQDQVEILLHYFGLVDFIPHRVSSSDGYSTHKDQLLGAALRLERRPDHCVVFDAVPDSDASIVSMRSVSLVDPHPRYELVSSDKTVGSLEDLATMDIRRLFSEPVIQTEVDVQQPQEQLQRKIKTSFYYDDD